MHSNAQYCCPVPDCCLLPLERDEKGYHCPNGHRFAFAEGTDVPVFTRQSAPENEYSREAAAQIHDNALRWLFATFGVAEQDLRQRLAARIELPHGGRLLVTGAGAGNDLPYLARRFGGKGEIYAQDIAGEMLLAGPARHTAELTRCGVEAHFSISDATNLPFADDTFDAAYHFGGINLFSDIRKGFSEMCRVVKPGGKVVVGDEGVAPWLKDSEFGRMLICNNPLYACDVPLSLLPHEAQSVQLRWELGNCFYVIEFTVGAGLPHVNADIVHLGVRGGSIRTRYFGQLEGVDPGLRDHVYAEASRRGMSRVDFLETLLRDGLAKG